MTLLYVLAFVNGLLVGLCCWAQFRHVQAQKQINRRACECFGEIGDRLHSLEHPVCKSEACVAERKRSAEKVGSSTDFSKTVSVIHGVGKTGEETDQ